MLLKVAAVKHLFNFGDFSTELYFVFRFSVLLTFTSVLVRFFAQHKRLRFPERE